jgi:RNA polymerase sigma-54 factor
LRLGLHQSARLEQRLQQSPQMIQAMQILQLPLLDLEARVEQELVENPFLERAEPAEGAEPGEAAEAEGLPESDRDQLLETFERLEREYGDGRLERPRDPEASDRRHEALQNVAGEPSSLHEVLIEQVGLLETSDRRRALLEYLVWSLDDRGFLEAPLEEVATELDGSLPRPLEEGELAVALAQLRAATHPGLAARDLRECLLLQLDAAGEPESLLRRIVDRHLPDVEANRLPRIAKEAEADLEEVKLALEDLRHLDPAPGTGFGGAQADVIVPEVVVEEVDGEWIVRLDREREPRLALSPAYEAVLADLKRGDPAREWIKKRRERAEWFLDALRQRKSTLRRIAEAVFHRQEAFLEKGVEALVPLRMQEAADELGVHISTISRGVSGKYAETPHGIFPLKFFFAGGATRDTGEEASQKAIQERLRSLIESEDTASPWSDEALAKLLSEREGLKLARRTVTKYRKALGIPSSTQRKQY